MENGADGREPGGFYADLWPAGLRARLGALPEDGAALDGEIATLRVLLRVVLAEPRLGAVDRLVAFGRGADYLARVYRLRAQLLAAAPPAQATLALGLARFWAEEERGGNGD